MSLSSIYFHFQFNGIFQYIYKVHQCSPVLCLRFDFFIALKPNHYWIALLRIYTGEMSKIAEKRRARFDFYFDLQWNAVFISLSSKLLYIASGISFWDYWRSLPTGRVWSLTSACHQSICDFFHDMEYCVLFYPPSKVGTTTTCSKIDARWII